MGFEAHQKQTNINQLYDVVYRKNLGSIKTYVVKEIFFKLIYKHKTKQIRGLAFIVVCFE